MCPTDNCVCESEIVSGHGGKLDLRDPSPAIEGFELSQSSTEDGNAGEAEGKHKRIFEAEMILNVLVGIAVVGIEGSLAKMAAPTPITKECTQMILLNISVQYDLKDKKRSNGRLWQRALNAVKKAPGFVRLYWGRRVEEPDSVHLHIGMFSRNYVLSRIWDIDIQSTRITSGE